VPGPFPFLPLLLLGLLVCSSPAAAGVDSWTPAGPPGGTIRSLLVDPSAPGHLYAVPADEPGLFKTLDGGRHWLPLRNGLPADVGAVDQVVLAPSRPTTVYAAVSRDGAYVLYRSLDAGATWEPRSDLPAGPALGVATGEPDVLFTAGPAEPSSLTDVVFRSRDAGATWERVLELPPPHFGLSDLVVDPTSRGTLYVVLTDGVMKTTDGGETWAEIGPSLPQGPRPSFLRVLAIAPSAPELLYVIGSTAFRSEDGGASWRELRPFPCDYAPVVVHPRRPRTLYQVCSSQLARSRDGGDTWELVEVNAAGPQPGLQDLVIDPFAPTTLYVATTAQGVFQTRSAGARWTRVSAGLRSSWIRALALDPWGPRSQYAVSAGLPTPDGLSRTLLWRTFDGGASWSRWLPDLAPTVNQVVPDPHRPGAVYLATGQGLVLWEKGRGDPRPLWSHEVSRLAIDSGDPDLLYAASGTGLHRSEDAGGSWTQTVLYRPGTAVDDLIADPAAPGRVYAVTRFGGSELRLVRSDDGGWTWTEPTPWYYGDRHLYLVAGDAPGTPSTLYAGSDRSTDGGETWEPTGFPGAMVAVVAGAPPTLYVQGNEGPFRSLDGGGSWHPVEGLGDLTTEAGEYLVAHPAAPERLYRYGALRRPGVEAAQAVGSRPLLLQGGRFEARAAWRDAEGRFGAARPVALSNQAGVFTLPGRRKLLAALDVLDARADGGHFQVLGAGLLPMEATVTVTDRATGLSRDLFFPPDRAVSHADFESFPPLPEPPGGSPAGLGPRGFEGLSAAREGWASAGAAQCKPSATTLCLLDGRYRVSIFQPDGVGGPRFAPLARQAPVEPLLWESGLAWFDDPGVPSVVVQMAEGAAQNGSVWVLIAGLSDEPYVVRVWDVQTGAARRYVHPAGPPASVADLDAF
jgi:photosystem II stability/assembly factor-like uncharacterized protein